MSQHERSREVVSGLFAHEGVTDRSRNFWTNTQLEVNTVLAGITFMAIGFRVALESAQIRHLRSRIKRGIQGVRDIRRQRSVEQNPEGAELGISSEIISHPQ